MATQATQQTPYYAEIAVKYDGLKNDGSTVVAADVAIGDTVTIKDALDTDGTMLVCRPETATLENTKFLVTDVSPTVNQITTGTTRRGGIIKVAPWKSITGIVQASVANGVNAADALVCTDGTFALSASTSVASVAAIAAYVGYARAANGTGANALKSVQAGVLN